MAFMKKHKLHYAWVILLASCVLSVVSRADAGSFGVFVDPLVEMFGWKRGDISFAYTLAFLAGLPAVVVMGWMGDRYGARKLMIVSSIMIATGTVLLGTIKELWHFYVYYGLFVGSLGNAAFMVLLPVIVTRWFNRHVGVALGIYWAAMGLGPMIFAPLFRWLIETRGWESTFAIVGVVVGIILVAFSLLMKNKPQEMGLSPYGAEGFPDEPRAHAASGTAPASLRELLTRRPIWLLMGCHHLGCVGHAIILAHVVSMAILKGVPGIEAAGVLSTIAGASVISRFGSAVLAARIGGRTLLTLALIGQSAPIFILFFANDVWAFYVFAVLFGLCYGGEMVGFPIINRQMFGAGAPLGTIYSFEMLGASTGMGLGGWLGGMLFDLSGAFTWSIAAAILTTCLGLPLALALPRHRKPAASGSGVLAKA